MISFFIVLVIILLILLVFRSRSNSDTMFSKNFYKKAIFSLIVIGLIFFMATSGKLLIPQLLKIIKLTLPFLTKFIGI